MGETNYASGEDYVVEFLGSRFGFNAAYGTAACLAALSIPYFLLSERRLLWTTSISERPV